MKTKTMDQKEISENSWKCCYCGEKYLSGGKIAHVCSANETLIIRCDRCNVPSPYGSAHICDEHDHAENQIRLNPKVEEWFKKGLRNVSSS